MVLFERADYLGEEFLFWILVTKVYNFHSIQNYVHELGLTAIRGCINIY